MKPKSTLRSFLAAIGGSILAISSANATIYYWDSNSTTAGFGNTNGTWGTSTFWSTDSTGASATANTPITAADDVNFGTATAGYTGGRTVTIGTTQTFNSMTIGSASNAVTFSGGTALDLGNANTVITQNSASATTISTIIGGGTNGLTKSGNGRLILTGKNTYTGNTVVNGGILRFGSTWSNTWANADRSLTADSNLEINNGIVEAYYYTTRALGTAAGGIQLTGGRAGFTNLQGDNAGTPFVTFGTLATTVTWGSGAFKPTTFVLNDVGAASVMRFANPFDLNGAPRTIEVSATGAGGAANNGRGTYGTMEGILSGAGASLIKTGAGTLMLNGTNSYSGGTTINGGGVWFDKLVAMPASGAVTVNDGGILSVSVGNTGGWTTGASGNGTIGGLLGGLGGQSGGTVSYSGNVSVGLNVTGTQSYSDNIGNVATSLGIHIGNKDSGTGSDPFTAAGTITLSGNNSYTGVTQVNRGTLSIGTIANAGSNSNIGAYAPAGAAGLVLNGGTLNYTGSTITTNRGFTMTGAVSGISVATAGEKLTLGDSIITSTANQTLTVSGGTGSSLDINSLTYGSSNKVISTGLAVNIGTVTATTNNQIDMSGAGSLTIGNFVATSGGGIGGTVLVTGNINVGSNTFTKTGGGTVTYTGTSTTGNLTINGGAGGVTVGGSGTLGAAGSYAGNITHNAANTFTYNSSANQTLTGNHTGAGNLTVSGSGTLTLSGNNKTFTGVTTVSSGKLLVNTGKTGSGAVNVDAGTLGGTGSITGSVTIGDGTGSADAILAPGTTIGSLATGNLTFNSDGRYAVEVDGTSVTSDQTNVTGTVAINAAPTLTVNVTGTLAAGQKYFIVVNDDVDAVSGTFSGLAQGALFGTFGGIDLKISYVGDSVGDTLTGGNDIVLYAEAGGGGSPYDSWATSKGLTGLPGSSTDPAKDADPDGDGSNNLAEFAFNGDPLSGADNGKVYVLTEDSDFVGDPSSAKELILTVAVRTGTPAFTGSPSPLANQATDGITYTIEGSLDLASFTTTVNVVPTPIVPIELPPAGTGYEYRSFSLNGSNGLTGKGFLRAKVNTP